MGELALLSYEAAGLTSKLDSIDQVMAGGSTGMPRSAWRSKSGVGGDLFKTASPRASAAFSKRSPQIRRDAAGKRARAAQLSKGYPEYDPDQPRDEGGRFSGDGGSDMRRLFGFPGERLTIRNRMARAAVATLAALGIAHLPMAAKAVTNVMGGKPWHYEIAIPAADLHRYENEGAFERMKAKGYSFERNDDGTYSVLPPRTEKYRPDQARDERGRWAEEGGGGSSPAISSSAAIDAIQSSADNLMRTRTVAAANRFLEVTKDTLGYVADGLFDDDATFWRRMLSLVATVFQAVAAAADAIGIGTAVGIGVGSVAGASAGVGVAVALAAWLTYEKWSEKREGKRNRREVLRTRARVEDLESQLAALRARRRRT